MSEQETTPTTPEQPHSPHLLDAADIYYGSGTIAEKRAQLQQLLVANPADLAIPAYIGDLNVDEDLERRQREDDW